MLHLVSQSPFTHSALLECLNFTDDSSCILLISSGVYSVNHPALMNDDVLNTLDVYALEEDISARGLSAASTIKLINYDQMVALTEKHKNIMTWS